MKNKEVVFLIIIVLVALVLSAIMTLAIEFIICWLLGWKFSIRVGLAVWIFFVCIQGLFRNTGGKKS